mgnify:CR=1 FL=1|tara:strand:- start:418 stop:1137 length:720 start_codon:yes stop_codon:yes gene_type:complete
MKHNWLVRPSQLGGLMSKGRGKDFGDTAMKMIQESALFHKYGIEPKQITSKQMEKGTLNEREGMQLAKDVFGWDIDIDAPKVRLFNDFMTGEPDINQSILGDIKCSYSAHTFPWLDTDVKNKAYTYQMQSYLWLTNHQQCELVYCLTNTPDHIIQDEIQRKVYQLLKQPRFLAMDMDESFSVAETEAEKQVHNDSIFDKIPKEKRVKRFIIERDETIIWEIQERITKAREIFDQVFEAI